MANLPTPVQQLIHPLLEEKRIELFVKRDDLIHAEIMGNKWRKLKYNLIKAKENGFAGILTLGGAYSNHIAAAAAAASEAGLASIGIIRGEELTPQSNPTLELAHTKGMDLNFISREDYRRFRDDPQHFLQRYPDHYFLPEGGTNELAIKGCKEIIDEIEIPFDVIVAPIGTGGTLIGIIAGIHSNQSALGISVLKGDFIHDEVNHKIAAYRIPKGSFQINTDYHFGGYGKTSKELIDFINWFKEKFNIPLDPIYTGKSFFGVWNMIKTDKFEKNLRIILLHTGGLQGIDGFNRKNENIIQ